MDWLQTAYAPAHEVEDQVPSQYETVKNVQLGSRATDASWHLHSEDVREALSKALTGVEQANTEDVESPPRSP